jgi:hypothetical protein
MITIDPNLRGCGVARWERGALVRAEYVENPHTEGRGYKVIADLAEAVHTSTCFIHGDRECPIIIEHPRVYPGMAKVDLNDLLDVMGVGAAVAAKRWAYVQHVFPSEWKGTMKKAAMLERIASKLTDAERAVVQKTNKSDTEDILDAVGIGLWKLGRLSTKIYPGAVP